MTTIPAQFVNDSGVVELEGSLVTGTPLSYPRVIGPYSFAYSDAGLNDGLPFYTPTIGDILLDVWINITTAWDGTTPLGDVGPFLVNGDQGLFYNGNVPADMTNAASTTVAGYLWNDQTPPVNLAAACVGLPATLVPALIQSAAPLKFVVSQDASRGGTAPGASQGAADLYVIVATPELP